MRRENDNITNLPVHRLDPGSQELVAYDPYANAQVPDDEVDIRELWRIVVKYRSTIFAVLFLVVATTLAATLLMHSVYRATAMLEIKPDSGSVVKFQNLEQADSQPLEYKTTQQNILQSESVAEAVIEKLDLADNPELAGELKQRGFISGIRQIVTPLLAMVKGTRTEQNQAVSYNQEKIEILDRFGARLSVTPIKRSNLFNVSFESFDPVLAANVANAVVEQYMQLNQTRRFGSTSGAKEFLQKEISKVQAKLEASEGPVKAIKDGIDENQWSMLFLIRLVPAVPFFVANLLPAFLEVPLRRFVISTFFGIIPGTVVYTSVGAGLGEVFAAGETPNLGIIFEPHVLLPILGLCVLAALPIAIKAVRGKSEI